MNKSFVTASRRAGPDPHDVRRAPPSPPGGGGRVLPAAAGPVARGRDRGGVRAGPPGRLHPERPPPPAGDAQRQLPREWRHRAFGRRLVSDSASHQLVLIPPVAVPGAVPLRRVPGVRRRPGRGGGVARLHAGAAVRLPARRGARLQPGAVARPEVGALRRSRRRRATGFSRASHDSKKCPQVPAGGPGERLAGGIPHRLQPLAPRVPAALLSDALLRAPTPSHALALNPSAPSTVLNARAFLRFPNTVKVTFGRHLDGGKHF